MKYIRVNKGVIPNKTKEITKEELIFLLGENRFESLFEDKTAKSMGCGILLEVNPTPYGTSEDWAGIQW